jgi:hypothetical protein
LNAIHIANNDGVTYVNVYRRSLSSSLNTQKPKLFWNLNLQAIETRKDSAVHVSLSSSSLVKQPGSERTPSPIAGKVPSLEPSSRREAFRRPHSTTNDNRLLSAVGSLILVRSFTGTNTCLGQGPRQRRAQWAVYKPAQSSLSTVVVNKSSHHRGESCTAKKSRFLRTSRRT